MAVFVQTKIISPSIQCTSVCLSRFCLYGLHTVSLTVQRYFFWVSPSQPGKKIMHLLIETEGKVLPHTCVLPPAPQVWCMATSSLPPCTLNLGWMHCTALTWQSFAWRGGICEESPEVDPSSPAGSKRDLVLAKLRQRVNLVALL